MMRVAILTLSHLFSTYYTFGCEDTPIASMFCTAVQQKSHLYIPRKGIALPQSQFPDSCVAVSDLYIPRIGPHISLQQNRQTEPDT
jgi:hypothetical protein